MDLFFEILDKRNGKNIWMDAWSVMETDGGRDLGNLQARLGIVYSGAVGANDNRTLSSRNVETPTGTWYHMGCEFWQHSPY